MGLFRFVCYFVNVWPAVLGNSIFRATLLGVAFDRCSDARPGFGRRIFSCSAVPMLCLSLSQATTMWLPHLTEKFEFTRRLKMLFSDGVILTPDGVAEDTYTNLAIRNAKQAGAIQFGDRLHTLWRPLSRERAKALAQSVKNVADVVNDRIEAEMHSKDLDMAFSCFDLRLWHEAKEKLDKGQVQ